MQIMLRESSKTGYACKTGRKLVKHANGFKTSGRCTAGKQVVKLVKQVKLAKLAAKLAVNRQ